MLSLLTTACGLFGERSSGEGEPVARVYNKYLYRSDLEGLVNDNISTADSSDIINYHIDSWIRRNLLLNEAEDRLPNDNDKLEKQVRDYRASLLLFMFEQELLSENLDSVINEQHVNDYYEAHKAGFVLRDNAIKASFVVVKNESPHKDSVRIWLNSMNNPAVEKRLKEYCFQYAGSFTLIPIWYEFEQFRKEIPIATDDAKSFLQNNTFYQTSDAVNTYYVKIVAHGLSGDVASLDYKRNDVNKIIINKRKLEYIKEIKDRIYQNALNNNHFEVY